MPNYNLGFIADSDFSAHVRAMIERLTTRIDLVAFERNVVDPIKLMFTAHAYRQSPEEVIKSEVERQLGKTVENMIGTFHQEIFTYVDGCEVPHSGMDVICLERNIYAEIKNKHNTMNSSSAEKTFEKLKGVVIGNPHATAYLVEVISKRSQDEPWTVSGRSLHGSNANRVRRISIDRFYQLVTGDENAFFKLCKAIGPAIDDVLATYPDMQCKDTVLEELRRYDSDLFRGLLRRSFGSYLGFENL